MAARTPQDPDFSPTGSRPASLWPETRDADLAASTLGMSRFDPLADLPGRQAGANAFDVCHAALALRAVLLVQGVLAVTTLSVAGNASDWLARQGAAAFGGIAGTLLWLVSVCALRRWLLARGVAWRASAALLLGAAAALLAWWPLALAGLADHPGPLRPAGLALAGAGLAALLWAWLELRARVWQPATSQARLAELQSRIRPHFLFNALNTAVALVRIDPARAESVLEDLSELFRVALAEAGASVTLDDEVQLARRYLAIEQLRYGTRLKVDWRIDARAQAARLPPLVLQPLVENAVRHGIEPAPQGGRVWIEAAARRGQAVLVVHNTVVTEHTTPGHGIALRNVRERLHLLHDVGAQLDTWRDDQGFHARITVPLP